MYCQYSMLPGMDGLEVCRSIRQRSTVPIIILTARGEETDKIAALDQGADDYPTKPFGVGELLARVKAVLQRFGELEIDFEQRRVCKDSVQVKLSPTEFELLQQLALHPGKIFTHETLLRCMWGAEYRTESEYLRVYVGRLRRKLESDPARPAHILTEPGMGYYLVR